MSSVVKHSFSIGNRNEVLDTEFKQFCEQSHIKIFSKPLLKTYFTPKIPYNSANRTSVIGLKTLVFELLIWKSSKKD